MVCHIGFDKIVAGETTAMDTHALAHDLHHTYFEVDYAGGTVPMDRLFGAWHDGSATGEAQWQTLHTEQSVPQVL